MKETEIPANLVPPITDELLAKNKELQEEWKKGVTIPTYLTDVKESWQMRDSLAFSDLVNTVLRLEAQYSKDYSPEVENKLVQKRDELAAVYFRRGEISFAFEAAASEQARKLYEQYKLAQERAPGDKCEHWQKGYIFIETEVKSEKHDFAKLPCLRCIKCNFRRISPLSIDDRRVL